MHEQLPVSALIDNGKWREDLVSMLFFQRDKEVIFKIPLSLAGGEDVMI